MGRKRSLGGRPFGEKLTVDNKMGLIWSELASKTSDGGSIPSRPAIYMGPTILDAAGGVHLVAESLADAGANPASPNICGQVAERQLRQTVDLLENLRGFESLPTHQSIEELRKMANGTLMAGAFDRDVTAVAPARVRVPRLATLLFQPYRVTA